ncbi:hypothetical protein AB1M95_04380 [Sulfitobacter sp. LCG007]
MDYTTIDLNGLDPEAPLVFLIDIDCDHGPWRYVGASALGIRLPKVGFPWIVQKLVEGGISDPFWSERCEWVHVKMLEAWVFDRALRLKLLENPPREILAERRKILARQHGAGFERLVGDTGALEQSVAELRLRALALVRGASSAGVACMENPLRWRAAVIEYARAQGLGAEAAEAALEVELS